jgi:hypothetical protein
VTWQAQFGGIFDRDHPLSRGDSAGEKVEKRGLARTGPSRHDQGLPVLHRLHEHIDLGPGRGASRHQIVEGGDALGEPPYRHQRTVDGGGRQHGVETGAIGQTGIDHG